MANFGHGGNVKEISRNYNIDWKEIIDFSANINPIGMSDNVKKSIMENLNEIEKYPDISYFELKEAIGEYVSTPFEEGIKKTINWLKEQQ